MFMHEEAVIFCRCSPKQAVSAGLVNRMDNQRFPSATFGHELTENLPVLVPLEHLIPVNFV